MDSSLKYYHYLDDSPLFKLSLSSKELFHSNFLEYLSSVNPKSFERLINKMAGLPEDYDWPDNWSVLREYHNFDLCVVEQVEYCDDNYEKDDTENSEDELTEDVKAEYRILFVIENKVKSIPYEKQLKQYSKEAEDLNKAFYGRQAKRKIHNAMLASPFSKDKYTMCMNKEDPNVWYMYETYRKKYDWLEWKNGEWKTIARPTEEEPFVQQKYIDKYIQKRKTDIHFVLLTLAKSFPNGPSIPDINSGEPLKWEFVDHSSWNVVTYSDYANLIRGCFKSNWIVCRKKWLPSLVLNDYCCFIDSLSGLANYWERQYKSLDEQCFLHFRWDKKDNNKKIFTSDYLAAKQHRIHDLYQKLKYSYFCCVLYERVSKHINDSSLSRIKVFPTNQDGLFKEGQEGIRIIEDFICVNQTFLHGEPLLEINIHPSFKDEEGYEVCFAIQVQGGVYERGLQVKKWGKKDGKVSFDKITADMVWKMWKDQELAINYSNEWMRMPGVKEDDTEWYRDPNAGGILDSDILPKRTKQNPGNTLDPIAKDGKPLYAGYYKYDLSDSTYIYQSRRIKDTATIDGILNLMVEDMNRVVDWLYLTP